MTRRHRLVVLCLRDSVTRSDSKTCGAGLGWDSARRCCPYPGGCDNLTSLSTGLTSRRVKLAAKSAVGSFSRGLSVDVGDCRARTMLAKFEFEFCEVHLHSTTCMASRDHTASWRRGTPSWDASKWQTELQTGRKELPGNRE